MELQTTILKETQTSHGQTLADYLADKTCLILFLRHSGCTFCREALADLSKQRTLIQANRVDPVIVHMMTPQRGSDFLERYRLADLCHVSDPNRRVYHAFGIGRGSILQLVAPKVWLRGLKATVEGHGMGPADADPFQMPGLVLTRGHSVVYRHHFETAADRPDYGLISRLAMEQRTA
jgi:peroxiredoxin